MKKVIFFLTTLLFSFALEIDNADAAEMLPAIEAKAESSHNVEYRPHGLSMEILGRGGLYSFNYDYLVNEDLALGAGIASYSLSSGSAKASAWILPVYANYYVNPGKHRFFATGGMNLITASGSVGEDAQFKGSGIAGVLGGGYEFRGEDGFLFRAAPYFFVGKASGAWIGFTVGYSI